MYLRSLLAIFRPSERATHVKLFDKTFYLIPSSPDSTLPYCTALCSLCVLEFFCRGGLGGAPLSLHRACFVLDDFSRSCCKLNVLSSSFPWFSFLASIIEDQESCSKSSSMDNASSSSDLRLSNVTESKSVDSLVDWDCLAGIFWDLVGILRDWLD